MSLPDAPLQIPPDFGKGGANLEEGTPSLNAVMKSWYAVVKAAYDNLANPPPGGGGGIAAIVGGAVAGANGAGGYSLPGARVGDVKVFEFSLIDSNTPKIQNSTCFEDVITVDDQVRQTNESDLTNVPFVVLFKRSQAPRRGGSANFFWAS